MKKPDEKIQEKLWTQIAPEVEPAIQAALNGQQTKSNRAEMIRSIARICYVQGLCRGYDLGFVVFGDGDDDSDSDDSAEPVDVDENGEPT